MIFEEQEYQKECISNIIALLEDFDFKKHDNLKECLKNFHKDCPQPKDTLSNNLNIDILMETGTGKTFTYLNLIFELHKTYRQKKFIIFVPRKAILESVRQNITLTQDYFSSLYDQKRLVPYYYTDSKSLGMLHHYISNEDELSVLVLTNSAINKKDNILNKTHENALYEGKSVFEKIAALKPISIIDEPHLLKGEAFMKYFSTLKTLYFRFGATFPKEQEFALSNMAYCLDSISAFKKYLVKQVRVHSLSTQNDYISLKSTQGKGKDKLATFSYSLNGILKNETIKLGQNLQALNHATLSRIEKDKAYFTHKDLSQEIITSYTLSDEDRISLLRYAISLHFKKEQELFKKNIKALSLFFIPSVADFRGNKALLKQEFERLYKQEREKILSQKDLPQDYKAYLQKDFDENGHLRVHQGYFSGDAKLSKEKSTENQEAADIALILQDKEKLLSFASPLRFIFSVWALQEGWDNPNIFTLTKLSHTNDISTHQQVGRGLRLCVNNKGKRITYNSELCQGNDENFYDINYVDVLISEKEQDFIERLQKEINEQSFIFNEHILDFEQLASILNKDLANDIVYVLKKEKLISYDEQKQSYIILKPLYEAISSNDELQNLLQDKFPLFLNSLKPQNNKYDQIKNANKQEKLITIRQNLANDFKDLWTSINKNAQIVYKNIDTTLLAKQIAQAFINTCIEKEYIRVEIKVFDPQENKIFIQDSKILSEKDYKTYLKRDFPKQLLSFSKDSKIPLSFLLEIYEQLKMLGKSYKNELESELKNDLDSELKNDSHANENTLNPKPSTNSTNLNKALQNFANSPKTAFAKLKELIKEHIHSHLIQKVSFSFTENTFSPSYYNLIEQESHKVKSSLKAHTLGSFISSKEPASSYLYNQIVYDSSIELTIASENYKNADSRKIKVFAKLPKFKIPTPYHDYQPDFAYFLEDKNGKKIFFVCEAKGYNDISQVPENEKKKIEYARKFFNDLQEHIKDQNIQIVFNTRINKQDLSQCLKAVLENKKEN